MVLLIVLVVGLTRQPRSSVGDEEGKALRILDERFARGEIDEDEDARRRSALEASRP